MISDQWDITSLPSFKSRTPEELNVLWSTELPATREADPALWDTLLGFFEDAVVDFCRRPGHLVSTPRELLKSMKRAGREPFCGGAVVAELFRRGDLVRADSLKVAEPGSAPAGGVLSSLRASLGRYLWSAPREEAGPGPEDAVVPAAALARVADSAAALVGPIATAEIHTLQGLAAKLTGGSERDAAAVVAHLAAKGRATVLHTEPTAENPVPVAGVRLGAGAPSAADRGLLQTKAAHERLTHVAAHLEAEAGKERAAAVEAARSGDKAGAIARVQRKAALEKKLQGARATQRKLADVLMAVDEAESNREAVLALETGMGSLRAATAAGGVSAERVDGVAAELDDLLAEQQDTRLALQQLNAASDAELQSAEAELDELLREEENITKLADPAIEVPSTQPTKVPTPYELAEIELQKLLGEGEVGSPANVAEESVAEPKRGRIVAP